MEYGSKFEGLLHENLTGAVLEALPDRLGCTSNKCRRLMNNPGIATNTELILFSQLLQRSAWELYEEYGLGVERVSRLEANYHHWVAQSGYTETEPTLPYKYEHNTNIPGGSDAQPGRNRRANHSVEVPVGAA